jgi:hypothetical protein
MTCEPYVKPVIVQLHYATEPDVAIAQACKTTGSNSGPAISSCRNAVNPGACRGQGS